MALTYDNLSATTTADFQKAVVDNIFTKNPLLAFLMKNKKTYPGGVTIRVPIMYGTGDVGTFAGRSDTTAVEKEILTGAEYTPAKYFGNVSITKDEALDMMGPANFIDYLAAQYENCRKTLEQRLESDLFGAGTATATNPKPLIGLQSAVPITLSGIYGGINWSNTWWDSLTTTGIGLATYSLSYFEDDFKSACKSQSPEDKPNLIVATKAIYGKISQFPNTYLHIVPQALVDLGFSTGIQHEGAPIIWSPYCPAGYIYFLNTKYLYLDVHASANMKWEEWVTDTKTLSKKQSIIFAGQLVSDAPSFQKVRYGLT